MERLAALSGLVASVSFVVALALADASQSGLEPDPDDPSALLAEALVVNSGQTRLAAQLMLIGAFLFLWFTSYLYVRLRRAEGPVGWTSVMVLGGGIALATLVLVESGFYYAGSQFESFGADTQVAKMIHLWTWNSASLFAPAFGAVLFGSAMAGFSHDALPRWLALITMAMFIFLLAIAVVGGPGLGVMVGSVWTATASLTFGVGRRRLATA